jgi:peroxiredoxin
MPDVRPVVPQQRSPLEGPFYSGPEVGEALPAFSLRDQFGREVEFPGAGGPSGSVIVFHRGAAWCPFCRTQVLELQRRIADFEAAGVAVFAISPDPPEALTSFAAEQGITYPLLSDKGSEVIRRFGVLNTLIEPGEDYYGIPFPGIFVADSHAVVTAKFFRRYYRERETAETVLHDGLHLPIDMSSNPSASDDATVSAVVGAAALAFRQRANVYVRIALEPGMHVNGAEVPDGFVPTAVKVTSSENVGIDDPVYPPTRMHRIVGQGEVPVFEGDVEIIVPLVSKVDTGTAIPLEVTVEYQACTESECLIPRTRHLRLEVPVVALNQPRRA